MTLPPELAKRQCESTGVPPALAEEALEGRVLAAGTGTTALDAAATETAANADGLGTVVAAKLAVAVVNGIAEATVVAAKLATEATLEAAMALNENTLAEEDDDDETTAAAVVGLKAP